ncbi:DotU family type IV/VI secretion system protein [Stenotrophomonas maltophilia]|nr:DotU family type IV/VI secretion system protein [Stenotrophomonas maltophilia]
MDNGFMTLPPIIQGKVARKDEISFETAEGIDVDPELHFQMRGHSCNPMVDAAQPLLALAIRIRRIDAPMDAKALHARIRNQLVTMENELRLHGYEAGTLSAYRYCLCSFLDEAVMATPWGSQSEWAQHSLLSACHNETWGGEKFFSILSRLMTQPEHFRDVLEFLYLCLCLGFKGRYQLERDGQDSISTIMRRLHRRLRQMRGMAPATLTESLDKPIHRRYRLVRLLPSFSPWVAAALVMVAAYCTYAFYLDAMTAEVLGALDIVLARPG